MMNINEYLEIINGNGTYETIAKELLQNKTVGIGWTDEEYTHFDIIFKLGLDVKEGSFQRGIKKEYLFVSIIDHTSYGFVPNTIKEVGYITEKLGLHNDKLSELINGVISSLNNNPENICIMIGGKDHLNIQVFSS